MDTAFILIGKMLVDEGESIALMEPLMPAEGNHRLDDLAFELVAKASALNSQVKPKTRQSIGELVRSMNCYYSNLIEGHNTHPIDIDRALAGKYDQDRQKRCLQEEAKAHIEVQRMIDLRQGPEDIVSVDYMTWLHREFCSRLPDEFLWVENQGTGKRQKVIPGALRTGDVCIGEHIPPSAGALPRFLSRFAEAYSPRKLSLMRQIIAIASAHHRLLWIHPFFDGNGRVVRLLSHAYLSKIEEVGSSLWSVSRGLARRKEEYKRLLGQADLPRWNDLDGRGNLSARALQEFCEFFLQTCIDQVEFMRSLLESSELLPRIEKYVEVELLAKRLPPGSFSLLREALIFDEFERGKAPAITGYQERQARTVLKKLVEAGLLVSDHPKGKVSLGFPISVLGHWFPRLSPEER
jgi:Fic family protein